MIHESCCYIASRCQHYAFGCDIKLFRVPSHFWVKVSRFFPYSALKKVDDIMTFVVLHDVALVCISSCASVTVIMTYICIFPLLHSLTFAVVPPAFFAIYSPSCIIPLWDPCIIDAPCFSGSEGSQSNGRRRRHGAETARSRDRPQ